MANPNNNRQTASAAPAEAVATSPEAESKAPAEAVATAPATVDVELLRKYAPARYVNDIGDLVDQRDIEVKTVFAIGTVIGLPKGEASRAIKLGIATVTATTLGDD